MGIRLYSPSSAHSRFVVGYHDVVVLPAPAAAVWEALEDLLRASEWSKWVQRVEMDTAQLQEGAVVTVWMSTPLPFTVKVRLRLDSCQPGRLIVAAVDGDLVGEARVRLTPDGAATLGEVSWSLEMRHAVMRAMALVSGPLLRWGHDMVAETTIRTFAGRVGRRGSGPDDAPGEGRCSGDD
jgi:hypothetical protein